MIFQELKSISLRSGGRTPNLKKCKQTAVKNVNKLIFYVKSIFIESKLEHGTIVYKHVVEKLTAAVRPKRKLKQRGTQN